MQVRFGDRSPLFVSISKPDDERIGEAALSFFRGSLVIAVVIVTGSAWAEDLDARKTGPQLFEQTCSACHRSPHGLARNTSASALVDFLRQHYTTGPGPAGQLAAYLIANPGDARSKPATARTAPSAEPQRGASRQPEPTAEQPNGHRNRAQRGARKPGEGQGSEPAAPVAHAPEGAPGRAEASPGKRGPGEAKPTAAAEAPAAAPSDTAAPTTASADASTARPTESGDQSAFSSPTP
jgi:hypothetical protein